MSIKLMAAVWDGCSALKQTPLLVLLALADHADDDGVCWPSYPRLAARARTTERHVRRIMADLEHQGLIARDRRPGHETHYTLTLGGDTQVPSDTQVPGTPESTGGDPQVRKGGPPGPTNHQRTTKGTVREPPAPRRGCPTTV